MRLLSTGAMAGALLALAACGGADDTAAENVEAAAENVAENFEAAADNATNESVAENLEARADEAREKGEEKAEQIDDGDNSAAEPPPPPVESNVSGM